MPKESKPYEPLRPYRLERSDRPYQTNTYATEGGARAALADFQNPDKFRSFKRGTKWRITKRLNKSGTKVELIAEGVVGQ